MLVDENISVAYTRAMSTNLLQKDVDQLVPVVIARASFEKRRLESETGVDHCRF